MADEKKPEGKSAGSSLPYTDPFVEIVWFILSIFVLMYLINGIFTMINSGNFSLFGYKIFGPQKTLALSQAPSLIGGKVVTSKDTPVFAEPGVNQITTEPAGAKGTIIEGPMIKDGVKYWHVRFEDGVEGWVPENNLDYVTATKLVPLSSMPTMIGAGILTSRNGTALYDSPGGNQIDTIKKGTPGKIIEGPIIKDGVKYWHVKFNDGREGWVAEGDLEYMSKQGLAPGLASLFTRAFSVFKLVSILLSAMLVGFVVYLFRKLTDMRTKENEKIYSESSTTVGMSNPQWDKILKNLESVNESDWRLAVLEADIMLDTLLVNMGLPGETMADKLKAVEKSDFTTVDNAWEAHKVRNQIAHEGGTFMFNHHEAVRVIDLYKTVFEEFRII